MFHSPGPRSYRCPEVASKPWFKTNGFDFQKTWQNECPREQREGRSARKSSVEMLFSEHQQTSESSHSPMKWGSQWTLSIFKVVLDQPEVWPRTTQPAVHAQLPNVHLTKSKIVRRLGDTHNPYDKGYTETKPMSLNMRWKEVTFESPESGNGKGRKEEKAEKRS